MADYPISNVPRRVQYVNTGVGPYSFNFEILTQTDIAVYRGNTLLTLTTDYTVTINSNGTGSVTLTTAGTGNITIVGARAIQRSSDYTTNGDLFANTLNTDLDSQTIYSQQLAESLDRAISVPVTDSSFLDMALPNSATRGGKVFAFNAAGEPDVSINSMAAIDSAVTAFSSLTAASPGSSAAVSHIASGVNAVPTTVQAKLREKVSVKDYGAVGDGVADDTVAIENAINANQHATVFFPKGTYLVTRKLNITVFTYSIEGERNERGNNTYAYAGGRYSATNILFNPVNPSDFLVNIFEAQPSISIIGPFIHKNLFFRLAAGANGFQFGSESLPITDGPGGQSYVHGVMFDGCNFQTSGITFASTANGTMTLPGTRAIGLAKAFESVITDTSISNGDYGLKVYGCDKVNATRNRFYCARPYFFESVGSFTVQHTVYDSEIEGWAISPIVNVGCSLAISNSSFEANIGSPFGAGRFVLPSCTATVTANSGTLTFSRSMDNILIPYYSLIELTDGTNTDTCYVTAVNGTSVTVVTSGFRFTWSGTATTVTRIHNYGPLHYSSWQTSITNITLGSFVNTPWCVYVVSGGQMNVVNAGSTSTPDTPAVPIAVGNKNPGQSSMESCLTLNNISPQYCPTSVNPFIRVVGNDEFYGVLDGRNNRIGKGDEFHAYNKAHRKWIYTPARYQSVSNGSWEVVSKEVAGDANTTQKCWAWFLDGSLAGTTAGGRTIYFSDFTLPSTNSSKKIVIRAKTVTGTATMSVVRGSSGGGSNIGSFTVTSTWGLYVINTSDAGFWATPNTQRLFYISADADIYIESVIVSDEDPVLPLNYVNNSVGKSLQNNTKTLTFGAAATDIFTATGSNLQSYKVKAYCSNAGTDIFYATVYAEYLVQVSNFGGTLAVRGTSLIYKQAQSVNSGIYALDVVISATTSGSTTTLKAAVTKTGSGSDTTCLCYFEVEALGLGHSPITVV